MAERFPHSVPDELDPDSRTEEIAGDPEVQYTKEEANYRNAGQSNTYCGNCAHFTSSAFGGGICDIVAGDISPGAVSDFWEGAEEEGLGELVREP